MENETTDIDKIFEEDAVVSNDNEALSEIIKPAKRSLPKIVGGPIPEDYKGIVAHCNNIYGNIPQIDYESIYAELPLLSVLSVQTPTLQHISEELQKVQASKDRLAEIMRDVIVAHSIKKRCVDILKDSWGRFTTERNAESRKGDSVLRTSEYEIDFAEVEGLLKVCQHILKNLDSLHENLSRRVSVAQLQLKINDMGRLTVPDFNFNRIDPEDYATGSPADGGADIDPTTPINAEESEF